MRIGLCSLTVGEKYKEYTKWSRENKILYCKKHNYDFIEDESILDLSRPIPWSKIPLLLKYLPLYDYLVWVDADILIMNDQITIESLITGFSFNDTRDFIVGSDFRMINTGVMIIKNTEFSLDFIQKMWDNEYDPYEDPNERYLNWEQGSFINLFDKNYNNCQSKISVTDPVVMNSYWFNYFPTHFVMHFAGVRGELLSYLIRDYFPNRLDTDTDVTYQQRMDWLAGPVREHLDAKLKHDKEMELKYIEEEKYQKKANKLIDNVNEKNLINNFNKILEETNFINILKFLNLEYKNENERKYLNFYNLVQNESIKNILIIGFEDLITIIIILLSFEKRNIKSKKSIQIIISKNKKDEKAIENFNYLLSIFPNKLQFVTFDEKEDSLNTTHEILMRMQKDEKNQFDFVYIDDEKEVGILNGNFYHSMTLSHDETFLSINEKNLGQVSYLLNLFLKDRLIFEIKQFDNDQCFFGFFLKNQI
jgi:hypothetical protein